MNDDIERAFYSTPRLTKLRWLRDRTGTPVDLDALAEAISDGCGGCEQVRYGDKADGVLVSILWAQTTPGRGDAVEYVAVEVESGIMTGVRLYRTTPPWFTAQDAFATYCTLLERAGWEEVADYIGESVDEDPEDNR